MAQQWGAGQPGYQYPLQTGFPGPGVPQYQPGIGGPGLAPQPTGFPGQRPNFQQPQPTGFPGQQGFQQPQPTGYQLGGGGFQQQPQSSPIPPVPPLPSNLGSNFRQPPPPPSFLNAPPPPPQNRFNTGILPQATGYPGPGGNIGPLAPQVTGYVDPRLSLFSNTFLPANSSAPYAPSGLPQFSNGPPGGVNLQQSIQQYNQEQRGSTTQRMSWALGKAEKKQYDQIFRSWDPQSTGFISGQMALEVFGQSGLPKNDLAKIWSLADTDNRGKLNLAEFHIAMALIYRRLNGTEIPDQLPPELVPPSARDLDTSVTLLKDILRNDTSRSSSGTGSPVSLGKVRSFNDTGPTGGGGRKDATIYKYSDDSESAPYYQSRARHVDRRNVRAGNESPGEDLSSVKRQLEDTAKRLDKAAEDSASRTAEDEALDREMEDLRYRVKRVQEDLEYVSRGPRSVTKDDDRRRLERDLLHLLHERVPEVEKKIEERERRKEREKREWNRDRDRRNERFGRYDDRDYDRDRDRGGGRYDYDRRDREFDRDRDRGPSRGAYDRDDSNRERDRDYDRDRQYDRDRPYSRNRERSLDRERDRDRDYDRHRTPPPAARSPPPRPPSSLPPNNISNPPPPPKATPSPAPQLSSMTPEQRRAYIREQAQQRLQKRKEELGVVVPISPALDTTVEDRLAQEKKEAEEKAKQAEKQAEERERNRRERVENEKAIRQTNTPTPTPPVRPAVSPAPPPPVSAPAPPTPKRAPAPPPPRKPASRTPSATAPPPPSGTAKAPPPAPAPVPVLEEDPEDIRLRQREEEIRKQREARAERLRQLEKEEEESRRAEEEYEKRRKALAENQSTPRATPAPQAAAPSVPFATPPSPPPEVSSSTASTPAAEKSNNPFNRLKSQNSGGPAVPTPPAPTTNGGTNPFFRPTATASPAPPQSKSPAPSAKVVYPVAPGHSEGDDEWDDISEKEDDDTSEDELSASRDTRNKLAQQLFGSILPRPHSAAGSGGSQPSSPAPPAPPPPPPPAPAAPVAPPPPHAPSAPAAAPVASGDRSALLGAIVGGARLRKTVTNDRSAASVTGQVLGDAAPPPYISDAPSTPSAPLPVSVNGASSVESAPSLPNGNAFTHAHRQSVDWYADLAAEQSPLHVPPTITEQEEETPKTIVPEIQIQPDSAEIVDPLNDVDKSIEYRVRTLYPYEGQRPEDLSFAENLVVTAHPSQSGGDWWYGTLTRDGKSGFFPSTYVQVLDKLQAKAIYSYTGGNEDELPFAEGDILNIVDRSENDWWKTEKDGIIFIVPAAYMELVLESDKGVPETNDDIAPDKSLEDNVDRRPFEIETANGEAAEDESDDDESSEYQSFESDEDEDELRSQEEIQKDREMRARERQRVLEAAGLIVKDEKGSKPPRPARSKSLRGHRPPPGVPNRQSIASTASLDKGLPSRPLSTTDSILRVDDAFERYEAFKQAKERRFSVTSSIDNPPPSPTSTYTSSTLSPSVSKDGDSRFTHSFFHFLSRRTPSVDPDKPRLQISAPIISAPISSSTRGESPNRENGTNSPAFGTSWSSLVDHEVLQEIPQKERRRQEAIFELINTEAAYVRDLQLIVEVFYSNIIPLLDEKERTVIFANIEDLLLTNTTFLSSLEEKQKECRLYIDNIGEIMLANMSNMDVYMEYCVNHGNAIKVLQTLREEKPDLGSKLQQLRDETAARNLDLSSYLLAPMQRITRYPLLIRQILHYTQSEDDRKNIEIALDRVQVILNHINESIREQESRARLKAISKDLWIGQGRLDLTAPTRYMGARKLLKEGPLMKAKSGRKLRAFLCNDILVLTEDVTNTLYRNPIPLSEIDVRDIAGGRDDLAFRLVLSYPRGGDTIALRATSARDCDLWMKAIEEASKRCREAEKRWAHKRRSQI